MRNNFELRRLGDEDLAMLREIAEETFWETFASQNELENISTYVDKAFSLECVAAELANNDSEFYFIEDNSDVAGYLKLNQGAAQTENYLDNALEIERIYVRRTHQGSGAGKALLVKALDVARSVNVDWVWLGVWQENAKAIEFYKRFGFAAFGEHDFYMGRELQRDIMMKLAISSFDEAGIVSGTWS